MAIEQLALSKLRIDGGTQQRAKINLEVVEEYAERFADLPKPIVFFDGAEHWLAGGFHRYHAAAKLERKKIECEVRKGTQRDAILFSCGDNSAHGLRRSNADKRKAVLTLLADDEWKQYSDGKIADLCCVSQQFVRACRAELAQVTTVVTSTAKRIGKDGKKYPVKQRTQVVADAEDTDTEDATVVNMDSEPEPEVIAKPAKPGKPKVDVRKFGAFEKQIGAAIRANTALKDHCGGQFYHEQIRQHFNGILKSLRDWKKDVL